MEHSTLVRLDNLCDLLSGSQEMAYSVESIAQGCNCINGEVMASYAETNIYAVTEFLPNILSLVDAAQEVDNLAELKAYQPDIIAQIDLMRAKLKLAKDREEEDMFMCVGH